MLIINDRPKNKEELFNLRHASARNVIERIFGVLKNRFRILLLAPEYSLNIQARLPAALCAVHNFISAHEPLADIPLAGGDFGDLGDDGGPNDHDHIASAGAAAAADQPSARRDQIALEMWNNYLRVRCERGMPVVDDDDEDSSEDMTDGEEVS